MSFEVTSDAFLHGAFHGNGTVPFPLSYHDNESEIPTNRSTYPTFDNVVVITLACIVDCLELDDRRLVSKIPSSQLGSI